MFIEWSSNIDRVQSSKEQPLNRTICQGQILQKAFFDEGNSILSFKDYLTLWLYTHVVLKKSNIHYPLFEKRMVLYSLKVWLKLTELLWKTNFCNWSNEVFSLYHHFYPACKRVWLFAWIIFNSLHHSILFLVWLLCFRVWLQWALWFCWWKHKKFIQKKTFYRYLSRWSEKLT